MDVHRNFLQLLHDRAESVEILVARILKIDWYVDVCHAETADACRLIRQCLFMGVKPKVNDMADAQCLNVCELRFARLI